MPQHKPGSVLMEIADLIEQCDSDRMITLTNALSAALRSTTAPPFELEWAVVSMLVAIVRAYRDKDDRDVSLRRVHAMMALSMGMGEIKAAETDTNLH